MKVLHINTGQVGGAAWCAIRINKALVQEGVDSRMLFAEGNSMPKGVKGSIASQDHLVWDKFCILRFFKYRMERLGWRIVDVERMKARLDDANINHLFIHQPLSKYKNIAHHPLIEWADIIHLHWVPDFVDYPTFFKEVKKPIVWTLHDHYPAGGVQHYNSAFYPLPEGLKDIDQECRGIKREGVSKAQSLNVVAISELMADVCRKSDVLKGFPVKLIHNGVDTSAFHPYDKQESRRELGLVADAQIFLFSSYEITDQRKGLDRAIAALEKVEAYGKMLVCIGNIPYNYSVPEASFPIIVTGMLGSQSRLSKYYSAADFFLQCSYEEAFAQTPLEAMACGTPVISTPCSGASDLIRSFNGVICDGYDVNAIASGIEDAMRRKYDADVIRQYIVDNYQYDKIAKQYIELYNRILSETTQMSNKD